MGSNSNNYRSVQKMKVYYLATFVSIAYSNLLTISEIWENYSIEELQAECSIWQNATWTPPICDPYRSSTFTGQLGLFSSASENYGCWCDINGSMKQGSSEPPVNQLDEECQILHHNYNCIKIDDNTCNPRTIGPNAGYVLPLRTMAPWVDYKRACAETNPNSCLIQTCIVEAAFLRAAVAPVYQGNLQWLNMWQDPTFAHNHFDWEYECQNPNRPYTGCGPNGCSSAESRPSSEKVCCGVYPDRKDYNVNRNSCCANELQPFGTC